MTSDDKLDPLSYLAKDIFGSSNLLVSVQQAAMATAFEILLPCGADNEATECCVEALELVKTLEQQFSVYIASSDVSRLNASRASQAVRVSRDVINIMSEAICLADRTGGAFDVTAGPLVDAWGFSNRSGRKPSTEEIRVALELVGYQQIKVDRKASTVSLMREGVMVNLGAIGKGYALDQLAAVLVTSGIEDFMIHGGQSSVVARGSRRDGELGWPIALSHPIHTQRKLGRVWLRNESLSTSGSGNQFFHYRGRRMGHVIDPRTGWPSGDMLSLSVIAATGTQTDALATGLFVNGKEQAVKFSNDEAVGIVGVIPGRTDTEVEVVVAGLPDGRWEPFDRVSE